MEINNPRGLSPRGLFNHIHRMYNCSTTLRDCQEKTGGWGKPTTGMISLDF